MDYREYYIHRIIYYIYIFYVEASYWKVEIILALKFRAYYQFRRGVKFLTRPGSNVRRDEAINETRDPVSKTSRGYERRALRALRAHGRHGRGWQVCNKISADTRSPQLANLPAVSGYPTA